MTESEEMYLVTIARIKESGQDGPVPLSLIASELDVLPVSANQMIRKLEEAGQVCYTPYHGVELTEQGQSMALRVLRHRRLWEVFLVKLLNVDPPEASEIACRMEHLFPAGAGERLAEYLDQPTTSPTGLPIPAANTGLYPHVEQKLVSVNAGETCLVSHLEADRAGIAFLTSEGIFPGAQVHLLAIGSGGAMLVQAQEGETIHLSAKMANCIWIQRENITKIHPQQVN